MSEHNPRTSWIWASFALFGGMAGLLAASNCGAPDEIKRVSVKSGGEMASSGSSPGSTMGGSSASSAFSSASGGNVAVGGSLSSSSVSTISGGRASAGEASGTGGRGGSSNTGGRSAGTSAGGSSSSTSSTSTGGSGGTPTTYPSVGGSTGGTLSTATGGRTGSGGTTASSSNTSTTPVPTNGLAVYVVQAATGGTGQITLNLRIDNRSNQSVDSSTLTLRYYYTDQGEGLGTNLSLGTNYVSIGHGGTGKVVSSKALPLSPATTDADHYFEFTFSGIMAAKGDPSQNDQFTVNVRLYNASYQGNVDVKNDYSYNGGATGYNEKIVLLLSDGSVIWGNPPSGGGARMVDAGVTDANHGF